LTYVRYRTEGVGLYDQATGIVTVESDDATWPD
jgi:hypothetical protein